MTLRMTHKKDPQGGSLRGILKGILKEILKEIL